MSRTYTKRERSRIAYSTLGHRARSAWGEGDLPAPFAEGDIVDISEGAECLMGEHEPGAWVVEYCWSVDEGDAWHVRLGRPGQPLPWRHPVAWADRSNYDHDVDRVRATLIDTFDPEGLALRERMIADGWALDLSDVCPTCGARGMFG